MEKISRESLIYIIIGILSVTIIILFSLIISSKNNSKNIQKELNKIKQYEFVINSYKDKINKIDKLINEKDSIIFDYKNENIKLQKQIKNLENKKQIKKDETFVKINNVNDMSISNIDSFFSDRVSKNSNN